MYDEEIKPFRYKICRRKRFETMITYKKAAKNGIRALSRKLAYLLSDKNSQIYKENVTNFGIPDEYVRKAFDEDRLLNAQASGKSTFYLALENACRILGFAQINKQEGETAELDRIIIFPEYARKGVGTKLLEKALTDQRKSGIKTVIVNAGRDEIHARKFYEKNGFQKIGEMNADMPWGTKLALVTYQLDLIDKHQ